MMDEKLIEAIRAKYQYEMKSSVAKINKILFSGEGDEGDVDYLLGVFKDAKDKGSYFEGILKSLNPKENGE